MYILYTCCRVEKSSLKNSCANKISYVQDRVQWWLKASGREMGLENSLAVLSEVAPRLQLRNGVVVADARYGCDGVGEGGMGGQY
jgi:hypothetical protein